MKKDIETIEDIKLFIDDFYNRLLEDENVNHFFKPLDLEKHLPRIYSFWETLLLGNMTYKNNAMAAHAHLGLEAHHIKTWLQHFETAVSTHFDGDKTTEAITRSRSIGYIMKTKFTS